jgi:transposase
MARRCVCRGIKDRVPILYYEQGKSIASISTVLGIKKTCIYDCLKNHRLYGVPYNVAGSQNMRIGRRRVLSATDVQYVIALLEERHTIYLDEIRDELLFNRGTDVSIHTILRTLRRLHFTHKKITSEAIERNAMDRELFWAKIADLVTHPDQLMFTDETSQDRRTSGRNWGWSLEGFRCITRRFFVRGQRYSILPVMTMDGIITYDIFPGSVTSEDFIKFLCDMVVCRFLLISFL